MLVLPQTMSFNGQNLNAPRNVQSNDSNSDYESSEEEEKIVISTKVDEKAKDLRDSQFGIDRIVETAQREVADAMKFRTLQHPLVEARFKNLKPLTTIARENKLTNIKLR